MGARDVVEKLNDSINAHDVDAGRDLYDPEARLVTATGRTISLAGVGRMLSDSFTAFPDMKIRVDRWIEQGDVVVTEEMMEGTHSGAFAGLPATNRAVHLAICHVTRVVDGKIVERVAYHDSAGILRQLS